MIKVQFFAFNKEDKESKSNPWDVHLLVDVMMCGDLITKRNRKPPLARNSKVLTRHSGAARPEIVLTSNTLGNSAECCRTG